MKFSSQEEYGLRLLLRVAREAGEKGLTIPEISNGEGITQANVAKILRIMRIGGLLDSARGQVGGYTLAKPADQIFIADVLNLLGGKLYDQQFCNNFTGAQDICTNSIDCSIKSIWQLIQGSVDNALKNLTLKDLIASGEGDVIVSRIGSIEVANQ
jgi:Rrf2 family transcriptional regulator, iron-sulfur cluster assembly transcription factor